MLFLLYLRQSQLYAEQERGLLACVVCSREVVWWWYACVLPANFDVILVAKAVCPNTKGFKREFLMQQVAAATGTIGGLVHGGMHCV